uniref:Transglutaminase-like domain-containing protein n=1 Tax=Scophthalmus maximus TaxID=52904 RepID=A0A8D3A0H6_SCOMX
MRQIHDDISSRHLGRCQLKLVDFEVHENHALHETRGLSERHLVVRRGKPFKLTLLFRGRSWDPHSERLLLQVCLGSLTEMIPVQTYDKRLNPHKWSAQVYTGPSGQTAHPESVTVHICSPVLSSVAAYNLLVHIGTRRRRRSYAAGSFVLLCNPWLKDDPVYMPSDGQIEEYVKSDYGLVFMGTNQNVHQRPWSFGQYEPGVLEACLKLLEVSPQHLSDKNRDYTHRADPVYISRVICAMVNCNDDLGILLGKWQGSYEDGVRPTEWSGSADILRRWVSNNFSPVRYGQCWVFASVLCTVMRVLGIPSRVVTVFNAAHDGNKLNISKDSIWNFHVWVECWMQRPDLGARFDGWQVVDPTPQEKSAGIYCCGPCPVAAVQQRCLSAPFDTSFLFASVNAEVIRFIVRNRLVVGRTVDTKCVGQLIYTKNIGSDTPEDLTLNYKRQKSKRRWPQSFPERDIPFSASSPGEDLPGLEVSLNINGKPSVGESVGVCVTVTNRSSRPRVLEEHVNAQVKDYNSSPQESFWTLHQEVHIHTFARSHLAVVIKDVQTQERVLETQEFNITSPQITIEIEGGDSIRAKKEQTARVSFTNTLTKALNGAVLTVEGSGLLSDCLMAALECSCPGEKIEKTVSIKATSPGTKVLMASLGHGNGHTVVSRCFRKVSVVSAS